MRIEGSKEKWWRWPMMELQHQPLESMELEIGSLRMIWCRTGHACHPPPQAATVNPTNAWMPRGTRDLAMPTHTHHIASPNSARYAPTAPIYIISNSNQPWRKSWDIGVSRLLVSFLQPTQPCLGAMLSPRDHACWRLQPSSTMRKLSWDVITFKPCKYPSIYRLCEYGRSVWNSDRSSRPPSTMSRWVPCSDCEAGQLIPRQRWPWDAQGYFWDTQDTPTSSS